jgi:hypothetical protein
VVRRGALVDPPTSRVLTRMGGKRLPHVGGERLCVKEH